MYNTNKYDGDGRLVVTGLTFSGGNSTTAYYLNSSVLGLAVAKLYSNGQRLETYVYAGGRKLATTTPWQVVRSHEDPVTGSHGISLTQGYYGADAEFTADGINVGLAEPTQEAPDFPEFKTPTVGGGDGCSIGNPNCVTVFLDGLPEQNWARVAHLLDMGFAKPCPDNDCGPPSAYNHITAFTSRNVVANTLRFCELHGKTIQVLISQHEAQAA